MNYLLFVSRAALAAALVAAAPGVAVAQDAPPAPMQLAAADPAPDQSAPTGEEIIVTGTRASGITAAESATPIKLLSSDAISHVGQPNLNQALTQLVPSFVAEAFGGDTANLTLSAKLRGLSPNHTLVLVNGKRRHGTANLHVLGGAYQGGAAPDLDLISPVSIQRIEVLEQGAAAQYGSDAIAGVINLILKDNDEGGEASATAGQYYGSDGETASGSFNLGTKFGEGGFLNLTGFYRYHDFSQQGGLDRRVTDMNGVLLTSLSAAQRALYPNQIGFPYVNKIVGDARSKLYNLGYNSGYDFGGVQVYSFGTWSHRVASAYENFRVADRVIASPVLGVAGTLTTPGELIFAPRGFNPREGLREDDWSTTGGIKGESGDFHWDLSSTYGQDKTKIYTLDSANASLFVNTHTTPTDFYDGFFQNKELTLNLDVTREFDFGMPGPLTLAFGAEYRDNRYTIGAGDAASVYFEGGQSYPGFRSTDAGTHKRTNYSGYVDIAAEPLEGLKLDVAGRYEHYSDFGSKFIGKLTGRYDFSEAFALRGTASTGFRAPTLAEEFYSATNVAPTSATVQLPANSTAASLVGFRPLDPEKSTTFSAGVVARPVNALTLTVDAYQVTVKDRVIGSGSINGRIGGVICNPATNPTGCLLPGQLVLDAIALQGNILDPQVGDVSIAAFTNGVNTRTRGIDATFSYPVTLGFGKLNLTVSGNYNETKIRKITINPALLDATALSILEDASPKWKVVSGAVFSTGGLNVTLRETLYGKTSELVRASGAYPYVRDTVGTAGITDLEVGYDVISDVTLTVGANNLFNKKPPKVPNQLTAAGTGLRPNTGTNVWNSPLTFSPYGINGGYYYARVTVKF